MTVKNNKKESLVRMRIRRMITSWVIIAVVFFSLGSLISYGITAHSFKADQMEQLQDKSEADPESPDIEFQVFGQFDDRNFTQEISLDWGAGDLDGFVPINCSLDEHVQEFTYCLCKGYNLDFALIMAMMNHESSFNPSVISVTNDYGLMQINECNHSWLTETLGVDDFLDPYQNIRAGCFVIRKLFEKYDDTAMVLMAYNMGENGASNLWKKGIYSTGYSDKITAIQYEYYEELGW